MVGGKIYYSLSQQFAIVKLFQKMTWEVGVELNTLFSCLLNELKLKILYLDMSETTYIDSTVLGIFVHSYRKACSLEIKMVLCAPSEICESLLTDVGLNKILKIDKNSPPEMGIVKELPLGDKISASEIENLIRQAHEELINLNDKNKELFSNVVETLNKKKNEKE